MDGVREELLRLDIPQHFFKCWYFHYACFLSCCLKIIHLFLCVGTKFNDVKKFHQSCIFNVFLLFTFLSSTRRLSSHTHNQPLSNLTCALVVSDQRVGPSINRMLGFCRCCHCRESLETELQKNC